MAKRKSSSKDATRGGAEKPYQVFVSHATADKWLARTLCEKIESVGATIFRDDRDINGGGDIPEEIRRQIKQSQEILVLLTPESVNSQWVTLEVGAAWGRSKHVRIIMIMCHVAVDPIPDMIKNKKALKLNNHRLEGGGFDGRLKARPRTRRTRSLRPPVYRIASPRDNLPLGLSTRGTRL